MDKEEVKATLKDVISNLIKDDPEAARQGLHDVLANKMRDRVSPPETATEVTPPEGGEGTGDDTGDGDGEGSGSDDNNG